MNSLSCEPSQRSTPLQKATPNNPEERGPHARRSTDRSVLLESMLLFLGLGPFNSYLLLLPVNKQSPELRIMPLLGCFLLLPEGVLGRKQTSLPYILKPPCVGWVGHTPGNISRDYSICLWTALVFLCDSASEVQGADQWGPGKTCQTGNNLQTGGSSLRSQHSSL